MDRSRSAPVRHLVTCSLGMALVRLRDRHDHNNRFEDGHQQPGPGWLGIKRFEPARWWKRLESLFGILREFAAKRLRILAHCCDGERETF